MLSSPVIQPGYLFSQHSLDTYRRCKRRFLLKYVDRQPWPCLEDDNPLPYRQHLERGRVFHHWLARRHVGIDMGPIVRAHEDLDLRRWWREVERFDWCALPSGLREAELPVVVPIGAYRLYARFDLLALDVGGDAVIVDWKTLERRPSQRTLRDRMQTRIYLYALIAAGRVLTGGTPIAPDQASMLYWFAIFPEETATVSYSEAEYCRDGEMLEDLIKEVANLPRDAFAPTDDVRQCAHCNYATLCHREAATPGVASAAGDDAVDWLDEDVDFAIELEQVQELDY
jgi:CRISPR/Cas system-associated exonuclease Cas4 (RecB family)